MKLEDFNYDEFATRTHGKIGLTTMLTEMDAEKTPVTYARGTEIVKGNALHAIPFIPNSDKVVLMCVFLTTPATIKDDKKMTTEPIIFKMVVGKGANVVNCNIGDIVALSINVTKHQISVAENNLSNDKLVKLYSDPSFKISGDTLFKKVYVVEYITVPHHGIEGIYQI